MTAAFILIVGSPTTFPGISLLMRSSTLTLRTVQEEREADLTGSPEKDG
ncbi:hypothetical protein JQ596_16450 [Bradyrhizobium manausense]|nr:hypothetical protein [Bradyrhizobium arachidis]MBR0827130.1 hypothetical protein [Bradyrhizobium manausense]UVO27554.1 hypothetical protein KUF59_34500 [Bradyrhizobium arachidis]